MDTIKAFARGEASRGEPLMVFDWDKAACLIKEAGASVDVSAGLCGDWEWTGGEIYRDGAPVDQDASYVYLASTWATPELEINGHRQDCWKYQDDTPGWDAGTYWPESAVTLLKEET